MRLPAAQLKLVVWSNNHVKWLLLLERRYPNESRRESDLCEPDPFMDCFPYRKQAFQYSTLYLKDTPHGCINSATLLQTDKSENKKLSAKDLP